MNNPDVILKQADKGGSLDLKSYCRDCLVIEEHLNSNI